MGYTNWQAVNAANLTTIPQTPGVYFFWSSEIVYIGMAESDLRRRLAEHFNGYSDVPVSTGWEYCYVSLPTKAAAESEEIFQQHKFMREHGRLPRYNKQVG